MYDNDVTVWSPQGRLFQVEYACEAVKQGSVTVGMRSKHGVVLTALKRSSGDTLASSSISRKIFKIDEHLGVSIAGLTSDARALTKWMQAKARAERSNMGRALPIERLVMETADRAQAQTQRYGGRPFGVGMLIAGVDEQGPHLWEFSPSGEVLEWWSHAIGARSQGSRTYIDKHLESLKEANIDELIQHALLALRDTVPIDTSGKTLLEATFNPSTVTIAILPAQIEERDNVSVSSDVLWAKYLSPKGGFSIIDTKEQVKEFLDRLPAPSSTVAEATMTDIGGNSSGTRATAQDSGEPGEENDDTKMDVDTGVPQ